MRLSQRSQNGKRSGPLSARVFGNGGGAVIRVAINGFGRIGRCLTRLMAATDKVLELVAINSRADIARDIHLFKYDSVHGRFPGTVAAHGENLIICLLYTSDAADEEDSVDLGGR